MKAAYTTITSKRARRIRIAVYPDSRVVVTRPRGMALAKVEAFVQTKQAWIESKLQDTQRLGSPDLRTSDQMHFLLNRNAARKLVKEKLEQWNQVYNFEFGFFSIKKLKTRWGSCSPNGDMSFNYKILFLSEPLQDFVIIHELCHLRVRNHGRDFWNLVGLAKPQFRELQQQLRMI
jgi:predicted metal-dependent hydrolase